MPLQQNVSMLKPEVKLFFISLFFNPFLFELADREVQRILLELLNQMDGFDQSINVKVSLSFNQEDFHYFNMLGYNGNQSG